MNRTDEPLLEIYLRPGESELATQPAIFRTVLGSCVGITFWHQRLGLGAMCHPMLPSYPRKPPGSLSVELGRRYVDFTIREMAEKFDARGARRDEVEIKLFGGADVLPVHHSTTRPTVGRLNCDAALTTLDAEGFEVAASSLGGKHGVNIHFDSRTGEVLLRRLR
jgi:chemotaxis protein CheD